MFQYDDDDDDDEGQFDRNVVTIKICVLLCLTETRNWSVVSSQMNAADVSNMKREIS